MLFKRFKLQLPKDFRKGTPIEEPPPEDICACGCPVSAHSQARIRVEKRVRTEFGERVDIRWRGCDQRFTTGYPCGCPGFWKQS